MNKNIIIIIIFVLVLSVLGLVFVFGDSDSNTKQKENTKQNVTLEAASRQASYGSGDEVSIGIQLTNSSETDVCLGEGSIGNIRFTSFTRDGNVLETRSAPSYFLTSFTEILKSRLTTVAPGANVELDLTSSFDPGLGAVALSTTKPEDSSGMATFYNVEEPGQYNIEMVYEYVAGPSATCKDILTGSTNKATATFIVE